MSFLYEKVATEIGQAIDRGVYPPGSRLPSIRSTRERFGVSVATVLEAFARLESKGLVEVRPKSGHFVKSAPDATSLPRRSRPSTRPAMVSIVDIAMEVLSSSNLARVPLGSSVPQASTLPLDTLARLHARAARVHRKRAGEYEDPMGSAALRGAIAKLTSDSGAMVDPAQIVITNGAQEALNLGLRAVTSAGDVVAVESPVYFGVLQAIEALGLRVLELPTHPTHGVDIDALEKAAKSKSISACVLCPCYQNPLGFNMSDDNKQAAVSLLNRYRIPLIEDDVFGALGLENPRPVVARSFDRSDNVLLCSSFSKTISPGLRLGWIAPGKHLNEVIRQKFLENLSTGSIAQQAMVEFLDGNRFRRTTQTAAGIYANRLRRMRESVLDSFPPGTTCTSPKGGFFLWVELPARYDSLELFRLAARESISLSPGRLFSRGNTYKNCIRLSCGKIEEERVEAAIRGLANVVHKC
jgi:DNA-binding transcriptional MocR family regulator